MMAEESTEYNVVPKMRFPDAILLVSSSKIYTSCTKNGYDIQIYIMTNNERRDRFIISYLY